MTDHRAARATELRPNSEGLERPASDETPSGPHNSPSDRTPRSPNDSLPTEHQRAIGYAAGTVEVRFRSGASTVQMWSRGDEFRQESRQRAVFLQVGRCAPDRWRSFQRFIVQESARGPGRRRGGRDSVRGDAPLDGDLWLLPLGRQLAPVTQSVGSLLHRFKRVRPARRGLDEDGNGDSGGLPHHRCCYSRRGLCWTHSGGGN